MTSTNPTDRTFATLFKLFAIDVRALAVLRMAVGLLVLGELFNALGTYSFFYGEHGFLTIPMNQVFCPPGQGFWSLHWIFDAPWWVTTLMILTGVSAIGLVVGWRTRELTLITLVLFWSLNVRNPLVTTAGHVLLRMVLVWMIFLPMNAVWSLDARIRKSAVPEGGKVFSIATVALMIQIAMMYFFSGIAKWNEVWMRGEALEIALNLDLYVKPLGHWLAQFPMVTRTFTLVTVIMELTGPLLLFLPFGNRWLRAWFLLAFCLMHVGIWLTMSIGIFSLVAISCWIVFLPGEFWNRFDKRTNGRELTDQAGGSQFRLPIWSSCICGLLLINAVLMNCGNAGWLGENGRWFRQVGNVTMTTQEFVMFGRPSPDNIWFELRQGDGKAWETIRGPQREEEDITDPDSRSVYLTENSQYWRRTLFNLASIEATTEEDHNWLFEVRKHFASCWLKEARRRGSEAPLGNRVQLICWRRKIERNSRQPTRREFWADFVLNDSP